MVPSNIVYDTITGQSRSITQKDTINKTSAETAFYAMQTLRIKNQEVLVFYDSGSNGHLVDGQMAENLDLDILTEENVPVGGIGGKVTWSEYGMYSLTLGPDVNGECHELELQGMAKLTSVGRGQYSAPWKEISASQSWWLPSPDPHRHQVHPDGPEAHLLTAQQARDLRISLL